MHYPTGGRLADQAWSPVKIPLLAAALLAIYGCAPANYTECTKRAAKDARSDLAMRVLIQACVEEYPDRHRAVKRTSDEDVLTGAAIAFIPVFAVGYFFGRRSVRRNRESASSTAEIPAIKPSNKDEARPAAPPPAPNTKKKAPAEVMRTDGEAPDPGRARAVHVDPQKIAQYREFYKNYSVEELLNRRKLGADLDRAAHAAIVELLKGRGLMLPSWHAPTINRSGPSIDNTTRHL